MLDDTGKLLSAPPDGSTLNADAEQLQYAQQIEQLYSRRILDILEPLVGKDNVKAQVTAELDFSQTESTTESHKPNQTPDSSAVRSQQLVESTNGTTTAPSGIPGATTNQPPAPPAAPINGQAQTVAAAGQANGANNSSKKESIVNYEVDKTVRVVRGATGVIKRVNAAVVLNHRSVTDAKGVTTSVPLTDAEIEKMTALVREAVGFSKDRGDSVNLMNAPFAPEKVDDTSIPLWRQADVLDTARSFAWPLGMLALAAMVFFGAIRPAMKSLTQPPVSAGGVTDVEGREGQLDALEADMPERPQLGGPDSNTPAQATEAELRLEDARKLTRDNPAAVANIVKAWMNGEAPA